MLQLKPRARMDWDIVFEILIANCVQTYLLIVPSKKKKLSFLFYKILYSPKVKEYIGGSWRQSVIARSRWRDRKSNVVRYRVKIEGCVQYGNEAVIRIEALGAFKGFELISPGHLFDAALTIINRSQRTSFAGVTILLSLTVFLNMVAETMPATSDAVPLLGELDLIGFLCD